MRRPYHIVDRLNLLMPSASVIKLLSNPRIPINALVYGSGINRNSRVANQLSNLTSGINYYLILKFICYWVLTLLARPFDFMYGMETQLFLLAVLGGLWIIMEIIDDTLPDVVSGVLLFIFLPPSLFL